MYSRMIFIGALVLVFFVFSFSLEYVEGAGVQQEINYDTYNDQSPKAYAMVADLLIARPLLIGATVVGVAVFVVSLPFSALAGGVKEAAHSLVVVPGREAFVRCLGCTTSGYIQEVKSSN